MTFHFNPWGWNIWHLGGAEGHRGTTSRSNPDGCLSGDQETTHNSLGLLIFNKNSKCSDSPHTRWCLLWVQSRKFFSDLPFLPFITFYSLRIKAILLSLHTYKSNGHHFLPTTLSWDVRGEGGKPCHVLTLMLPWTIMIPPKLLRKSYCDHIHHSWRSQLTKCSNVQWLWEAPYRPSTGLLPHS